ncbi:MAG: twin-arginine translocation signal domain-containing protein, partial [Verrucomicrobiota bacterium]
MKSTSSTDQNKSENPSTDSRRSFLQKTNAASIAAVALGTGTASTGLAQSSHSSRHRGGFYEIRRAAARLVRYTAARKQSQRPNPQNQANSDERNLSGFIGSFTKTLPHVDNPADPRFGEVDPAAYRKL